MTTETFLITMLLCGAVTFFLRLLPFVVSGIMRDNVLLRDIGRLLPLSVMVILMCYTFKETGREPLTLTVARLAAVVTTALLQLAFRNVLLSILGGTLLMMAEQVALG